MRLLQVPKTLVNILSNCDSVSVLIWASAAGWKASLLLVCGQGILTLPEAMDTWMEGMKVSLGGGQNGKPIVTSAKKNASLWCLLGFRRSFDCDFEHGCKRSWRPGISCQVCMCALPVVSMTTSRSKEQECKASTLEGRRV